MKDFKKQYVIALSIILCISIVVNISLVRKQSKIDYILRSRIDDYFIYDYSFSINKAMVDLQNYSIDSKSLIYDLYGVKEGLQCIGYFNIDFDVYYNLITLITDFVEIIEKKNNNLSKEDIKDINSFSVGLKDLASMYKDITTRLIERDDIDYKEMFSKEVVLEADRIYNHLLLILEKQQQ